MQRFLNILIYATYPLLAISLLILVNALGFGAAFVTGFTVENRTAEKIEITPVGTIGTAGFKRPLPVKLSAFVALDAFRIGGYPLSPRESVTIHYDWDDINFSEIVIEDSRGRLRQEVTDPHPTDHQYHQPSQKHYVIEDLSELPEVTPDVRMAVQETKRLSLGGIVFNLLLVVPWLVYGLLRLVSHYSLVNVSSKFNNTRDTTVQAAN